MAPTVTPAADVYYTTDEIVVELEVHGYDGSELSVTISDHTLAVTGDRREEQAGKDKSRPRTARITLRASLPAPDRGRQRAHPAEYAKGVLTLHVPKHAGLKPRTVTIAKK